MLWQALGPETILPVTSEYRLFIKLLLRHIDPLCNAARGVYPDFHNVCKELASGQCEATIQCVVDLCRIVVAVVGVFVRLLQDTRRETPIRSLASILDCLCGYYSSALEAMQSSILRFNRPVIGQLVRVCRMAAILIERIVAAVPTECVDDDTARAFIPSSFFAPFAADARPSSSRQTQPGNSVQRILEDLLSKHVTYGEQYVRSVMDEPWSSASILDLVCYPLFASLSSLFQLANSCALTEHGNM